MMKQQKWLRLDPQIVQAIAQLAKEQDRSWAYTAAHILSQAVRNQTVISPRVTHKKNTDTKVSASVR